MSRESKKSNNSSTGRKNFNNRGKKKGTGKGNRPGNGNHHEGRNFSNKKQKLEIKFDAASRRDYISGLSSRKQQRRTFGLAMQKVKDRQKRLEERKEAREAQMENIEERERQQETWLNSQNGDSESEDDVSENDDDESKDPDCTKGKDVVETIGNGNKNEKVFDIVSNTTKPGTSSPAQVRDMDSELKTTTSKAISELHGGRSVTITTTFGLPDGNSSDEEDERILEARKKRKRLDEEQREAGNVKHYIKQLKGNLPSKKAKFLVQRKGNHGASNMHGMGGAANLNAAKRTLMGAEKKLTGRAGISAHEGKGKRRRGRK